MGQTVYGNYDQDSLDLEYDMKRRCPHFAETFASFESLNDRMISNFQCAVDVPFGDTDGQKLDVWHGREAGAAVVLNDYDLCPSVTMTEIVRQNRAALAWIYKNAGMIGGDPGRIHVTGHSAGGHLTAMLLATNWQSFGLPYDAINGAVPLSGLFDLEPLRLSYLNADLRMNEEEAHQQSPINNLPDRMPPTVVAVGGGETDEFRRQSRIYTDACRNKGFDVSYLEVGSYDHVMVSAEYRNLGSPLTATLMTQMGL